MKLGTWRNRASNLKPGGFWNIKQNIWESETICVFKSSITLWTRGLITPKTSKNQSSSCSVTCSVEGFKKLLLTLWQFGIERLSLTGWPVCLILTVTGWIIRHRESPCACNLRRINIPQGQVSLARSSMLLLRKGRTTPLRQAAYHIQSWAFRSPLRSVPLSFSCEDHHFPTIVSLCSSIISRSLVQCTASLDYRKLHSSSEKISVNWDSPN